MEERKKSHRIISTEVPLIMFNLLKKKSKGNDVTVSQILRMAVRKMFPGELDG